MSKTELWKKCFVGLDGRIQVGQFTQIEIGEKQGNLLPSAGSLGCKVVTCECRVLAIAFVEKEMYSIEYRF
jgi:hypothetical protein